MPYRKSTSFKIPVKDFKRIETPLDRKGYRNYLCIADVLEVPDMREWNTSNVRDAKGRGKVPDAIREGLLENELFVYMNRGIVIMAERIDYDNKSNNLTLWFSDPKMHGIIDGGHTRLIISEETSNLQHKRRDYNNDTERQVRIEILVGFDLGQTTDIAGARNTSNQVKEQSLLELEDKFEDIKKALSKEHYRDDIAYKEYQLYLDVDRAKPIDIRDIIAILYMFDYGTFSGPKHPISAYSAKSICLAHFKQHCDKKNSIYKKLYPILPDILRLRDEIYLNLPKLYSEAARMFREKEKGDFGKLTGVSYYEGKEIVELPFSRTKSAYRIPNAFIYPILGAFRAFLHDKKGKCEWLDGCNPFDHLNDITGLRMVNALTTQVLSDKNPNKTGKSPSLWINCYNEVSLVRKDIEIASWKKRSGR